ncbi:HNH endonuclease signature motif containing protein [Hymenobacter guriensis]|uniref:HNH endonuclease n=1 Tax=Hymenobacter guriensis TaxID=2793065 RepID=A0ABS0KWU4_9BACT|nr:HNH endonuclease [Hymenobacter guriensis]
MKQSLEARFWSKVDKTPGFGPAGDCWIWTASLINSGYGRLGIGRHKKVLAHRLSYEMKNGPIPEGLLVLHSCDNRQCVNPSHLSLGTVSENTKDMLVKGRPWASSLKKERTHCKKGHEYTPENTYHTTSGRSCKACNSAYQKARYLKRTSPE